MELVVKKLKAKNIDLYNLEGIELFARDGGWSTDFIAKNLKAINLVEIDSQYESILKQKYNNSQVYIENTYEFINKHHKKYDIILCDNPASKHGTYFQHFSLFPSIFNLCNDKTIIILNIIENYNLINYNPNKEEEHSAIKDFYKTTSITIEKEVIVNRYKKLAKENNFFVEDYFNVSRGAVKYLVLFISKNDG